MLTVKLTPEFESWLSGIKDSMARKRLFIRLRKAELGNLGNVKCVGEGVSEMREFFGPGYRMYFMQRGDVVVLMLGGGDKSTQSKDIAKAIALSKTFEE